jgi:hypothetical protein
MPDFDWVKARAECSPVAAFEQLRAGVRQDVDERNELLGKESALKFRFVDAGDASFSVVRDGAPPVRPDTVTFSRTDKAIEVANSDRAVTFVVTVTVNESGTCRLVVGARDLDQWHVRRRALERLFFGS